MLGLWLSLLLVWLILLAIFWGGGLWLQAYLYSEPVELFHWRAVAAATTLAAFYAGWCFLAYQHPGRHDTLFRFNAADEKQFKNIWVEQEKQRVEYKERLVAQSGMPSRSEYVEAKPPYRPWQRSDSIVVKEDGQDVRFTPPRDDAGRFLLGPGNVLIYRDDKGRSMSEDAIGFVSIFRWDIFLMNVLSNLLHVALWFGCCWLILRFQWGHALLLALSGWAIMLVIVLPMLFDRAIEAAPKPTAASRSSGTAMLDLEKTGCHAHGFAWACSRHMATPSRGHATPYQDHRIGDCGLRDRTTRSWIAPRVSL